MLTIMLLPAPDQIRTWYEMYKKEYKYADVECVEWLAYGDLSLFYLINHVEKYICIYIDGEVVAFNGAIKYH